MEREAAIDAIILAEVCGVFKRWEDVEVALLSKLSRRLDLPFEASFLPGQAHLAYRRFGGRERILPDLLIGAHAAVADLRLIAHDPRRFRCYFPGCRW